MKPMYKGDLTCMVLDEQVLLMEESGWSKRKAEEKAEAPKIVRKKAAKKNVAAKKMKLKVSGTASVEDKTEDSISE